MEQNVYEAIRQLPRSELENFVLRAAAHMRGRRSDADSSAIFAALLTGFLLGAFVAAAGFLLGAGLT